MIAIIEQTFEYKQRMQYQPDTHTFVETEFVSLNYVRGFPYPYGWIKESGTPPEPHWDVYVMSDKQFKLGDEIPVKLIGIFVRNDGDHKFIAVELERKINELEQLTNEEKEALHKLYRRIGEGEGWYGSAKALEIYEKSENSL